MWGGMTHMEEIPEVVWPQPLTLLAGLQVAKQLHAQHRKQHQEEDHQQHHYQQPNAVTDEAGKELPQLRD